MTDHRIGLTSHNLPGYMDGDLQAMVDSCRTFFTAEQLRFAQDASAAATA